MRVGGQTILDFMLANQASRRRNAHRPGALVIVRGIAPAIAGQLAPRIQRCRPAAILLLQLPERVDGLRHRVNDVGMAIRARGRQHARRPAGQGDDAVAAIVRVGNPHRVRIGGARPDDGHGLVRRRRKEHAGRIGARRDGREVTGPGNHERAERRIDRTRIP